MLADTNTFGPFEAEGGCTSLAWGAPLPARSAASNVVNVEDTVLAAESLGYVHLNPRTSISRERRIPLTKFLFSAMEEVCVQGPRAKNPQLSVLSSDSVKAPVLEVADEENSNGATGCSSL
ncbi:hypothetical protein PsYK624_078340 [Phanerochaete sordida]|uniref:Uncharacterized protein n=1 Tax=Phanerochaete sordida TaxID=48140 RepID=A0A9P3GD90_9APHY|nr:hypothetical protein PsYK624_078340 [Phanerochaete sordida]